MEQLNAITTILSLLLGIGSIYFGYVTYVQPTERVIPLLRTPENWLRIHSGHDEFVSVFRHKRFSAYSIVVDQRDPVVENFFEPWISDLYVLDMEHNRSYYVYLKSHGEVIQSELFVSLDGGRLFVPVPRRVGGKEPKYYYDDVQVRLSGIVGRFYLSNDVFDLFRNSERVTLPARASLVKQIGRTLGVVPHGRN